jgi:hypothetical protein
LLRGRLTAAGFGPAFVCPAGQTTIVKSAYLFCDSAVAIKPAIFIRPPGGAFYSILTNTLIDSYEVGLWEGWVVLNEGDELEVYGDAAGLSYWVSGSILAGDNPWTPPPNTTTSTKPS